MIRIKVRFQHWVLGSIILLMLVLLASFLATVVRAFDTISEDHASAQFDLMADQVVAQVEGLIRQNGRFAAMQVRSDLSQFVQDGHINERSVVSVFLGSLESSPDLYSHFFGLRNDEFLQVIGIRGDPRILQALQAPPQAYYAVRSITRDAQGGRERYVFLDAQRKPVGQRVQPPTFVPTDRTWYARAMDKQGLVVTDPYLFASTSELGITVAAPLPEGWGVLATDVSLRSLDAFLARLSMPPNGVLALQNQSGQLIALRTHGGRLEQAKLAPLTAAAAIDHPYLRPLAEPMALEVPPITHLGGEPFILRQKHMSFFGEALYRLQIFAPLSDFTGGFQQAKRDALWMTSALLLLLLPLAYLGTRRVAVALTAMASDSERLKAFDFSVRPHHADTFIYEINALGDAQVVLQEAIGKRTRSLKDAQDRLIHLVETGINLAREQDRSALLRRMLFGARDIARCQAASLFLKTEHGTLSFALRTSEDPLPAIEIPMTDAQGRPNEQYVIVHAALHNKTVLIDDVYSETRFDLSGTKSFSEASGLRSVSMLTVPLSPRDDEVIGAIQLINAMDPETGAVCPFDPDLVKFVEALAAQSAVALENLSLIEAQKTLMDALIRLIAGAIDAKSPYTGGHCERVPELGVMLAQAACDAAEGPLSGFGFRTDDEWREFRIGAWLHDCGKVTTPEYVVDKACKLETIYNRIHEVRMRFEVLWRDARIARLEALARGDEPGAVDAAFEARCAQLQDDFAFLAECNLGGEFMAPQKVERLQSLGQQTWLRHFDDRLGLGHEELKRYTQAPEPLPAVERLLADKPQHIIPRPQAVVSDPAWGFKVKVPTHLYNYGELYNLRVSRGTLTEEERFKINEHVMQSLVMLEQLPLPKNLRRVPEYAGTHHETLTGTGYPRKLDSQALTVPMRIMAIADIFEALTASDRPYKKAKTLSESVQILWFFKKDGHIDADLFDLFLTSGVYRRYAERYLQPDQIDTVDIQRYLGPVVPPGPQEPQRATESAAAS